MERASGFILALNALIWEPWLLVFLLLSGLFLSIRLRFFPLRRLFTWLRMTLIDPFRPAALRDHSKIRAADGALAALAGTIGTGNIAGVATALVLGGAGAVFWMWVAALLGMAIKYAEVYLALRCRKRDAAGAAAGGALSYLECALGKGAAKLFALLALLCGLCMGNLVQSNTVAAAVTGVFPSLPAPLVGVAVSVLVILGMGGGFRRLTALTDRIVPVMGLLYILGCSVLLIFYIDALPAAVMGIFRGAFSVRAAAGGAAGVTSAKALRYGVERGVFSNEAGLGVSAFAHAGTSETEPAKQGLFGLFEVFIDTIVICTFTALAILCAFPDAVAFENGLRLDGVLLTQRAFETVFGAAGGYQMALFVLLFGYSSLLAWSYYGEQAGRYLGGAKLAKAYRCVFALLPVCGSVVSVTLAWELADLANGLMALLNLTAVLLLSNLVRDGTAEFWKSYDSARQKKRCGRGKGKTVRT